MYSDWWVMSFSVRPYCLHLHTAYEDRRQNALAKHS